MKKTTIFAAAAALLALGACSKSEIAPPNEADLTPVGFGTYVGQTKATYGIIDDAALKGDDGFAVFAYYDGAASADMTATAGENYYKEFVSNFMWNQQVQWKSSAWTYSPLKYWPNNVPTSFDSDATALTRVHKLSFAGYAPYVAEASASEGITVLPSKTEAGAPTVKFTVPSDKEKQIDLLYANTTNLANLTKQSNNGNVSFPFKHALTNIGVKLVTVVEGTEIPSADPTDAKNKVDEKTDIEVTSLKFSSASFNNSGTLNLATGAWTPDAASTKNFEFSGKQNVDENLSKASAWEVFPAIMTIPVTSDIDVDVEIEYTVTTTDGKLSGGKSVVTNHLKKTIKNIKFAQGKKYTIYVALGMTSVKIVASVEDWDNAEPDKEVWLPINTAS